MFDDFTRIPQTSEEAYDMSYIFNEINETLGRYTSSQYINNMFSADYLLTALNSLLITLSSLSPELNENHKFIIRYFKDRMQRLESTANNDSVSHTGIIINQEASTHFDPDRFPTAKYITRAQEFLKVSPQHFLRIFTVPENNYLYVYTNKDLTPDLLVKLYDLEATLHPKNNPLTENFFKAMIAKDADTARKLLVDYFKSDAIIEQEYQIFRQCLINKKQNKINMLEAQIQAHRTDIQNWENYIANYAAEIRDWSEELIFLRMSDDNEEHKLFFKHINKIPYLANYTTYEHYIELYYIAPLIYFADYPAEKMLKSPYYDLEFKEVVKIILSRKYELYAQCKMKFNTHDFSLHSCGRCTTNPNYIDHPHISRFNCFGNHRQAIGQAAETADYISAIEQITQAVLNINFYDACVVEEMITHLRRGWRDIKTWKLKDTNEWYSLKEILERKDYYEEA